MMYRNVCLQAVLSLSAALSVAGHNKMIDFPIVQEYIDLPCRGECLERVVDSLDGYTGSTANFDTEWFTHGTQNGCDRPTGLSCAGPCPSCDVETKVSLQSVDQLTYPILYISNDTYYNVYNQTGTNTNSPELVCAQFILGGFDNDTQKCVEELPGLQEELLAGNIEASPFKQNPWFYPGKAPVEDPCGVLGGWVWPNARDYIAGPGALYDKYLTGTQQPVNTAMPPLGMDPPAGTYGSRVLAYDVNNRMTQYQGASPPPFPTVMTAGESYDFGYTIMANHGGGHQYRLCPASNLLNGTLTEECFQANPMPFVGDQSQFISYKANQTVLNITFDALDVTDENSGGVVPPGSAWRKFGLSPCVGSFGGRGTITPAGRSPGGCFAPQYDKNIPEGIYGFGNSAPPEKGYNSPLMTTVQPYWKIVDKVKVPDGLFGDYVVQWRSDMEAAAQVWTECALVTIENKDMMLGNAQMAAPADGECATLRDTVCGSVENGAPYKFFCDLLTKADIDESYWEHEWTFFVPNDEGFEAIEQGVLGFMSDEEISDLIMFQMYEGQALTYDDLKCKETLTMLDGHDTRTKCMDGAKYQSGFGNINHRDLPRIIQNNIPLCHGIAHALDKVMLPPRYDENRSEYKPYEAPKITLGASDLDASAATLT
jgi:hypothetical protein